MCGILGWLGNHQSGDAERFRYALDLLTHRGPDDRGVLDLSGVLLGHRRLSILDLSTAGHQPMLDYETGASLVFNGEIYNHSELRKQLESIGHCFSGNSDTEVLLHALIEWGEDALGQLNGMWAFAFLQPDKRRLLISRDRFGVKPLYYRQGTDGFAFASEPKSLLALFDEHRSVSEHTLLDFLGNNLLYSRNESFYRGIGVFPPAHYGCYDLDTGQLSLSRFWDYPDQVDETLTEEQAIEQFDELFTDAVKLRLRSDVPVGLTLSGGLDSTGILAATRKFSSTQLNCFTSVYDETNSGELEWARIASESADATLIPVSAAGMNWLNVLRDIAWHMDGPGYSPAVYPLWQLMKKARKDNVPVLLEGQGADEELAGYPQYAALEFMGYLSGRPGQVRNFSGFKSRITGLQRTFSLKWAIAWLIRENFPSILKWRRQRVGFQSLVRGNVEIPDAVDSRFSWETEPVRRRLLEDHSMNILPGLLHYGDSISMAHSIEARHPFLDYRLVEWVFRLPVKLLFVMNETKWVLREYLRGHDQMVIGNRPDKKGYPTPVSQWLANHSSELESLLLDSDSLLYDLCDPVKVKQLIRQNSRGVLGAEHHLYKLLSTRLWLNECIEGQRYG